MAAAREPFEFSLRSASSEHYIERNEISSPNVPIVIYICCEIGKTIDYCSCSVKIHHCSITAVPARQCTCVLPSLIAVAPAHLPPQHQHVQCSVCIHGARVVARRCVCSWLQSLAACLLPPCAMLSSLRGSPRNAVHSSSV